MGQKNTSPIAAFNPFQLRAGTRLQMVNAEEKIIGDLFLENDADIILGFTQKNQVGVTTSYKTVACYPEKGIYQVREDIAPTK
jgi:hypothetical protein